MVLVAFQREVARLDQLQPFRLVHAGLGELRDAVGDFQAGGREGLAVELLGEHGQVVFVDVGVADEVREPARSVAGQAADQGQQCGAFGEVEWRAQWLHATPILHTTIVDLGKN